MPFSKLRSDAETGVESGYPAADRLLRRLGGSSGGKLRKRLQGAMGALSQAPRRRRCLSVEPPRRRQRRAARRARTAQLEAAQVAGRAEAQALMPLRKLSQGSEAEPA